MSSCLQEVHEFAIDVQLLDATVEAGGVPEVPVVERVRPDLGWNAGDEHGAAALLQIGQLVDQIQIRMPKQKPR